jgi:cytochrome P450
MREDLHELLIYALSHPFATLFAESTRLMGGYVDVPRVGRVVNEPRIARAILTDDEHFSKNGPGSFGVLITQVMGKSALLNMDGEPHRQLRGKLHDLFSPSYLRVVETELMAEPVAQLRTRLDRGDRVDMVRFAQLLTGRTIWHMVGLPEHESEQEAEARYFELFELTRKLTDSIRLSTKRLSESQVATKRRAFERLTAGVGEAYSRESLPERSVVARLKALGLTAEEARGVVAAILIAGTETVTNAIPRAIALLVDSGQLALLRADPGLRQAAVDEALRLIVPTPIMLRSVSADVEVEGIRFRAGQRVMLFTYNVLKWRETFPRPRRFDIRREQPPVARNLWFGAGHHFCLGFALAQRELKLVLDAVIGLPGELQVRRRAYARGVLIPGYTRLEVQMR